MPDTSEKSFERSIELRFLENGYLQLNGDEEMVTK